MSAANNHPAVQNTKETVLNGKVSTVEHLMTFLNQG